MDSGPTIEFSVHFKKGRKGRKQAAVGKKPAVANVPARLPRLTRLLALAIRFDDLIRRGEIRDYAEIARLGHITRARATQIMNLLLLAPDIQEAILDHPRVENGRDPWNERQVRNIAGIPDWGKQRREWQAREEEL